jgi:hypothetical protein
LNVGCAKALELGILTTTYLLLGMMMKRSLGFIYSHIQAFYNDEIFGRLVPYQEKADLARGVILVPATVH